MFFLSHLKIASRGGWIEEVISLPPVVPFHLPTIQAATLGLEGTNPAVGE